MVFNFSPASWHWDTVQPIVPQSRVTLLRMNIQVWSPSMGKRKALEVIA